MRRRRKPCAIKSRPGQRMTLRNTTDLPDALVRAIVRFVKPSNVVGFSLTVRNTKLATFQRAQAIADRITMMRAERASMLGTMAGIGPWRNVWQNAMHAYRDGMPWQDVDYSLLRKAIRVDAMPSPTAKVDVLWHRYVASVRGGK